MKDEKTKWYNKNFFWIVSFLYMAILIVIYACVGSENLIETSFSEPWPVCDTLREWLIRLGNMYIHVDWSHVLHNCLGFFLGAVYVEKKIGSVNFALLLLVLSLLIAPLLGGAGNSLIWFALWGYMFVDFVFSFRKSKRKTSNIILGSIMLILEYVRSGFYDTESGGIAWGLEPVQLIHGHDAGFLVGIFVCLIIQFVELQTEKRYLK